MKLKTPVVLACAASVALMGCTIPSGQQPSASTPAAPTSQSASTSGPASTAASASPGAAALALVRDGATLPTPVASVPMVPENGVQRTLTIFEVRSTADSTRLMFAISGPGDDNPVRSIAFDSPTARVTNTPRLKVGGNIIGPLTYPTRDGSDTVADAAVYWPTWNLDEPRPGFAVYPALPAGTTDAEIVTPLVAQPIKVPVQLGREQLPQGTSSVPILGRGVGKSLTPRSSSEKGSFIFSVHGVRRVPGGTAVYFSLAYPAGQVKSPDGNLSAGTMYLRDSSQHLSMVTDAVSIVDRSAMKGYAPLSAGSGAVTTCNLGALSAVPEGQASVCATFLPTLDASTKQVDVSIDSVLLQDVPVEDGPMTPTKDAASSADLKLPLGAGWPEVPADLASKVAAGADKDTMVPLSEMKISTGVTDAGKSIDLNAQVLFEYNKATLTPAASEALQKAASAIRASGKTGSIKVVGYTDSDGEADYNKTLSKQRAQAVSDALEPLLGSGFTFEVDGKGEDDPVSPNDSDAGKAANRRVTVTLPN